MEITTAVLKDIQSLSSRGNFQERIGGNTLLDLLKSTNESSSELSRNVLYRMKNDAIIYSGKNKYVALKWLMYLHQGLQITRSPFVVDIIVSILEQIIVPKANCKFQKYMLSKLYQPYLQYLIKTAGLIHSNLGRGSPSASKQGSQEFLLFSEFNLMMYVGQELMSTVKQFRGYFQKFYPCLNNYRGLIGRDMRRIYKRVSMAYHNNRLLNLTYLEIQTLGTSLEVFTRQDDSLRIHSWLMTETQTRSENLQSSPENDYGQKDKIREAGTAVSSTCNI